MTLSDWRKWDSNGCPNCGKHSTVEHPGTPSKDGERKTVLCAVCYTKYKITGRVSTKPLSKGE